MSVCHSLGFDLCEYQLRPDNKNAGLKLWMKDFMKNVDSSLCLIIQPEQVCSHYEFLIMTNRSTLEIGAPVHNYALPGKNSSPMGLYN